ncbi:MarR family winged helix-turn-helix transcriptional regulator [Streptomyces sp. NBC_01166]|uniref:MarR family winged helix-turn-helix transcriptional regulator n=1 Tax=Streptomyces sp. NBC_01166 TaxID=2903755 RepID=UPI003866C3DE|nr:MarR family winged helix-turn-helix transcriptional regulator [Streptomyces sp. NBC_01166]
MHQPSVPGTAPGPRAAGVTPAGVLSLNAYLMYATGKAARRRLTGTLTAHGLRLWHLTILAMLDETGRLSKGDLASRLDMNQSDLTRTVTDLDAAGYVVCARDPSDRRRIEVALTAAGRCALARLDAEVSATEADLLAPLSPGERELFASLLRRVHSHLERDRAADGPTDTVAGPRGSGRDGGHDTHPGALRRMESRPSG